MTNLLLYGDLVHIDRLYASLHSPGRSCIEYRIFVNGKLAGHGGDGGSSLGGGSSSDLPAVALVGQDKIVATDWQVVITAWARD